MKINRIFTAAMAAMFMLSACMNEQETGTTTNSGDETYAGVSITIPAMSRAVDASASAEECLINEIGVYIIDQKAPHTMHSQVLKASDFTADAVNNKATATTAVKTVTGMKDVYVIVNPTAALTSAIESQRNLAFRNILAIDETGYYKVDGSKNLVNLVMTGHEADYDMRTVVTATDAVTPAKILKMDVTRNVAKVVLREKPAADGGIAVVGGTVSNIQYAMVAKNLGSYIPKSLTAANGTPYSAVPANAKVDPDDPYFDTFSTIAPTVAADYKPIVTDGTAVTAAKGFYVLENKTDSKRIGNTTAVRIKLKYSPDPAKVTIIKSWTALGGAETGVYSDLTNGTFYVYTNGDNSYWSEAAYAAVTGGGTPAIPATDFSAKYDNGIGYYKVYVAATNDGEKCVLRNNYYDMTLAKILGPGSPTIPDVPGENEDDPVEDDTWLGVELNMLPWVHNATEWTVQ